MVAENFVVCIDGMPAMRVRGIAKALSCSFAAYTTSSACAIPKTPSCYGSSYRGKNY